MWKENVRTEGYQWEKLMMLQCNDERVWARTNEAYMNMNISIYEQYTCEWEDLKITARINEERWKIMEGQGQLKI